MKVELELKDAPILKLVHEIICLDDAYKLLKDALPANSTILRDVQNQQQAYRTDFSYNIWEHSDRVAVAIKLFENLEFAERQSGGHPLKLTAKRDQDA